MSKPFKMKGWSGNQNPSPVQKDFSQVVGDFKAVAKDLSQKLKDIGSGEMARKIKSDIQGLKKEIDQKLGKKKVKESTGAAVPTGTEIDVPGASTDYKSGAEAPPPEMPYAETPTAPKAIPVIGQSPGDLVEEWTPGTGDDPWLYKKTEDGYQTKKGPHGKEIDITDPKSAAYQAIEEKIFKIESDYEEDTETEVTKRVGGPKTFPIDTSRGGFAN